MADGSATQVLRWTGFAPGGAVVWFVFLTAGLWMGCLVAWEIRQPELVVILLAAGSFVPLIWLGVRMRLRPQWVLRVRGDHAAVEIALRDALSDRDSVPVAPGQSGSLAVFQRCDFVFRIRDPAAVVGLERATGSLWTSIFLLSESEDREALERLRGTIASRLGRASRQTS